MNGGGLINFILHKTICNPRDERSVFCRWCYYMGIHLQIQEITRVQSCGWQSFLDSSQRSWLAPLAGPIFMIILALIFRPWILKLFAHLLQHRIQALTSSTLTQLFLTEECQPLWALETEDSEKESEEESSMPSNMGNWRNPDKITPKGTPYPFSFTISARSS